MTHIVAGNQAPFLTGNGKIVSCKFTLQILKIPFCRNLAERDFFSVHLFVHFEKAPWTFSARGALIYFGSSSVPSGSVNSFSSGAVWSTASAAMR